MITTKQKLALTYNVPAVPGSNLFVRHDRIKLSPKEILLFLDSEFAKYPPLNVKKWNNMAQAEKKQVVKFIRDDLKKSTGWNINKLYEVAIDNITS